MFHSSTFRDEAGQVAREESIFSIPSYIDTGIDLELKSSIEILSRQVIFYIQKGFTFDSIEGVVRHDKEERVGKAKTKLYGGIVLFYENDESAFDVLGRTWMKTEDGEMVCIAIPSKNMQHSTSYENTMIGRDGFRHIYQTLIDIVQFGYDPKKVRTEVVYNSPIFNQRKDLKTLTAFGIKVLKDLVHHGHSEMDGRRGIITKKTLPSGVITEAQSSERSYWDVCSKSDNIKKALFTCLNNKLFSQIPGDIKYYDIVSFLGENKDDRMFLTELRRDINTFGYQLTNEEIKQYLNEIYDIMLVDDLYYGFNSLYYGSVYKDGVLRHGLRLKASLATYLTTNEKYDFYKIPHSIWIANQEDLKSQIAHDDIYGAPYLGGTNSIGYKIEKGVITNRIFPLSTDADGLPIYKLSEKEVEEGWELGAAIRQPDGTIKTYPQALLTLNDRRVRSGFSFSDDGSVKFDPRWFLTFQDNVLSHQGRNYGIRILNVLATGQGAFNIFVYSETDLTNNHLKNGIDWDYANKYFTDESWTKNTPKRVSLAEWSFFDYDFIKDPGFNKILSEAEEFKEALFRIHRRQISIVKEPGVLAITEECLKKLNTFAKGDVMVEGKGYEQLSTIFTKLLGNVNYEDTNSRVYKITNIRFKTYTDSHGNTQEYDKLIRNIVFRGKDYGNSQKVWLKEILAMLKQYKDKIPASLDETDRLLYDLLITKDEHGNDISIFENDEFSPGALSDKLIQRDRFNDFVLAEKILNVLSMLIGRFTLYKIMTGAVYITEGSIRFIGYGAEPTYMIHRLMKIRLVDRKYVDPFHYQQQSSMFLLESLYGAFNVILDAENPFLIKEWLITGIPVAYMDPFYKIGEKTNLLSFYKSFSLSIWSSFKNWLFFNPLVDSRSVVGFSKDYKGYAELFKGLSLLYEMQINNAYMDLKRIGLSDDQIFMYKYLGKEALFAKVVAEDPSIRKILIKYFDSRGSSVANIFGFFGRNLNKVPDIFKNIQLNKDTWWVFQGDDDLISNSLFIEIKYKHKDKIASELLRSLRDFISELAGFLRFLGDTYGKIYIYGYTAGTTGFGRENKVEMPYYSDPLGVADLDKNMPGNDPLTKSRNDRFLILDPSDYDSFDLFRFLGALLVDQQIFVFRAEGMQKNEILFAFSYLYGSFFPSEIVISRYSTVKPGERRLGPMFSNVAEYENLMKYLDLILPLDKINFHKFKDYNKWLDICHQSGIRRLI